MEGLISLTRKTSPSNFYYVCEKNGDSLSEKMDELACFVPGMLALGASDYSLEKAEKIMNLAEELAWTCYNFYQSTPTKLAGENYYFHGGQVSLQQQHNFFSQASWGRLEMKPERNKFKV